MIPLLFCLLPYAEPATVHVDQIELNHYYDDHANPVFTQIILWQDGHVRAWRIKKENIPLRDYRTRDYTLIWPTGRSFIRIKSRSVVETWTQHDRELENRQLLPPSERKPIGD